MSLLSWSDTDQHTDESQSPDDDVAIDISERAPDAGSRRAMAIVLAISTVIFVALVPIAKQQLAPAHWFIPLIQAVLIVNDLVTVALLLGQLRLTRRKELLILAGGYLFAAVMAGVHMLTFPGVFTPTGLLGAGAQTTGYLHVFWHLGLPVAVIAYAITRRKRRQRIVRPVRAVPLMLLVVGLAVVSLALLATRGNDLLPPMLAGLHYSSQFNIGRYGQWFVTACAIAVLWRHRGRSVLDLWLIVMLCNAFYEIALVSIFNAGRYDVGFYAGRVFSVFASFVVLVMLLAEHGKLHRELADARRTARSEAALRESRQALALAMQGGRMAAWTRDVAGGSTSWSPELAQLTGWPLGAFETDETFFLRQVHPQDVDTARAALEPEEVPAHSITVEFRMQHADGSWRWIHCRGRAEEVANGEDPWRLFGVLIDITDQRQAQEGLRESEARWRLLADMIPQHLWVTEPDGHHSYFSRSWYEFTGSSREQSEGQGWLKWLHPDDREPTMRKWRRSLATGEPYSVEYRFRGADGNWHWYMGQAAPLKDSTGAIVRWFGTLTDITAQKEHEAERERLLASERQAREVADRRRAEVERVTESRARLMRGFSHDLRSPLSAAQMSAMLLADGRAWGPLNEKQAEGVRRIQRGIKASVRLIDDLLELARAEAGHIELLPEVVEVAEVAKEVADEFQAQAEAAGVELVVDVAPGVRVHADPARLRQILANLVSNAVKYAPRARATIHARAPQGEKVAIHVIDTGPGIPEDKREVVFEEYARLQPGAQQGSGIGLAISRRVARLMDGDLTLESDVGRGCVFTLCLPVGRCGSDAAESSRNRTHAVVAADDCGDNSGHEP